MPRRVLIFGGTGFCGSHLAELCLHSDERVFITGRKTNPTIEGLLQDLDFIPVDITRPRDIEEAIDTARPDVIYHLAGLASVARSFHGEDELYRINILGTHFILKAIRQRCPQARILVVGSAEEYGPVAPEHLPIREDQALNPMSPYGVSRVASSLMSLREARAGDLDVIVTRTFNLIGPRQSRTYMASDFAAQLARAKITGQAPPIEVVTGNLEVRRDFSSVLDGVKAYRLLIDKGERGQVYNVCSGAATRARAILNKLAAISGLDIQQRIDPARLRKAEVEEVRGDPTALIEATGFRPGRLDQALEQLYKEWHERLQNP